MIQKVKAVIVLFGLFLSVGLSAQQKDTISTIKINKAQTKGTNQIYSIATKEKLFTNQQSLENALNQYSTVQIRNYGLSNLSTMSIRGSSVAQTNVQWNGISIQNAMLGLADLSLLPTHFFDRITVVNGEDKTQSNQAALAGTVLLNSKSDFSDSNHLKYQSFLQYESFGNMRLGGGISKASKKLTLKAKFLHNEGRNAYDFYNYHTQKQESIRHAANKQQQAVLDAFVNIAPNKELSAHLWYIKQYREIAPTVFEQLSLKEERNNIFRSSLQYQWYKNKWTSKTTLGFTRDEFNYSDSAILLFSSAAVNKLPAHHRLSYTFNNSTQISLLSNLEYSALENGIVKEQLNRFWKSLLLDKSYKRWTINAYLQKEWTNVFNVPWTYGGTIGFSPKRNVNLYATYGKSYRIPTLNELYYFPGGNQNLRPESSHNIEGGMKSAFRIKNTSIQNSFSVYSRWVNDWIIWRGASIFFPTNIQEVWSRGLENQLKIKAQLKTIQLRTNLLYAYTLSTSEQANFVGDSSVGKQIPYVPRYAFRLSQQIEWKALTIEWQQQYQSYRFITTDESIYLKPFHLSNLNLMYTLKQKRHRMSIQCRFNNLFNTSYENIRGRVMPGRNFAIGFSYSKA